MNFMLNVEMLKKIKAVVFDIDGVLTDGRVYMSEKSWKIKSFSQLDTLGLMIAVESDLKLAWISLHITEIAKERGKKIGVDEIIGAKYGKYIAMEEFAARNNLNFDEIAYVGDDIDDYKVMNLIGMPIAVKNAVPEIKSVAKYITSNFGGNGAVRESLELILKNQGKWKDSIEQLFENIRNPIIDPTDNLS